MKSLVVTGSLLAVMAGAGYGVKGLKPICNPVVPVAGLEAHETHGSVSLLGQFRTSVSGWLWVRTDLYLHNGVQMRPMLAAEHHRGVDSEHGSDGIDEQIKHGAVVTVIPSADRDFRGVLGEVERQVSAYKSMKNHTHNDPKSALPLFRLMTWIDPQFIPGWTVGASVLLRGQSQEAYGKALQYLGEGLEHNPDDIILLKEMGYIWTRPLHDLEKGKSYFERVRTNLRGASVAALDEDAQEAARDSYRWLVLIERDTMRREEAIKVAREGLELFPEDYTLSHTLAQLDVHPVRRVKD